MKSHFSRSKVRGPSHCFLWVCLLTPDFLMHTFPWARNMSSLGSVGQCRIHLMYKMGDTQYRWDWSDCRIVPHLHLLLQLPTGLICLGCFPPVLGNNSAIPESSASIDDLVPDFLSSGEQKQTAITVEVMLLCSSKRRIDLTQGSISVAQEGMPAVLSTDRCHEAVAG